MKANPVKKERTIFSNLELQIALCNEKIKVHRRSIEKARQMCGWYGPHEVSGIDYSQEPLSGSKAHISLPDALRMVQRDEEKIAELQRDRKELRGIKKQLEFIYQNLHGIESQIFYQRKILMRNQEESAEHIHISVRHLQRVEKGMKEKGIL